MLGALCQWIAWWVRLPAILFLLLTGLCVGPAIHWLQPDAIFGQLLPTLISLSVAIILFEGGLSLRFSDIKGVEWPVRNLLTLGLLITWLLSAWLTHALFHFSWPIALLFGAITSVSGPTVIMPILRTTRPTARVGNILRWEGIAIDPIGALLALLIYNYITTISTEHHLRPILMEYFDTLIVSIITGVAAALFLGIAIRRRWIPGFLQNTVTLALVLGAFTLANQLDEGGGVLAVTLMGLILANMRDVHIEDILDFKESLSILLISSLFIILAARVDLTHLHDLGFSIIWLLLALQFIIRPLSIFVCTLGSSLNWREKAYLSWISPRGIVAAAVAALFSFRLNQMGIADAKLLTLLTFCVIIGTVIFQSATSSIVARLLKVAEPEPTGFLIIGANPVARHIATALKQHQFDVLLADNSWENTRAARMEGLPAYFGNSVSDHADRHLNLIGLGQMLTLEPQDNFNALACLHYRSEFDIDHIYTLAANNNQVLNLEKQVSYNNAGVFGQPSVSYKKMASLIAQGAQIKSTQLTENYDFQHYKETNPQAILLFAIDHKKRIHVFTEKSGFLVQNNWQVISLIAI